MAQPDDMPTPSASFLPQPLGAQGDGVAPSVPDVGVGPPPSDVATAVPWSPSNGLGLVAEVMAPVAMVPRPGRPLSRREWRFVACYLRNPNGTQAALDAKLTRNRFSAQVIACRLLSDISVRQAVDRRIGRLLALCEASQEHVIREAARIAFADPLELFDTNGHGSLRALQDIPEATRHAISSIKCRRDVPTTGDGAPRPTEVVEIRFCPKAPALELLAKRFGLVKDGGPAGTALDPVVHEHRHQVVFYMPENLRGAPG